VNHGLKNLSCGAVLAALGSLVCNVHVSHVTGQEPNPTITRGLARFEEGSRVRYREIHLRPRAENAKIGNRLVPAASEMIEGEGAPIFLRMNFEAMDRLATIQIIRQKDYGEKPLEDLNADEILGMQVIRKSEMRRFVYRSRAGWSYPTHDEPWMEILLPDAQESRRYAHAMTAYSRASILRGQLSDAEEWIRFTFGLARQVSETPFAVTRLVACAQTGLALDAFEELIQHPDADNYYWDLVAIPRPFIDSRETIQMEAAMWTNRIPALLDLDALRTEQEWMELATTTMAIVSLNTDKAFPALGTPDGDSEWKKWVAQSKERLPRVAPSLIPRLKSMSDAEIGIRYWWLRVQEGASITPAGLEPHLAIPRLQTSMREFFDSTEDELPVRSAMGFYSPLTNLHFYMIDQRIALLRIIESVRDWSASHGGKLPEKIEQLDLPVPRDVLSNQPFQWTLSDDGNAGLLEGAIFEVQIPDLQVPDLRGFRYMIVRDDV
jgi:hypothetical protein